MVFIDTIQKYLIDKCSTWTFYSVNMFLYQVNLFYLINFLRQAVTLAGEISLFD